MVPRLLHVVWIGDESKRPDRYIQTWRDHYPDFTLRVWGNADYAGEWRLKAAMEAMYAGQINGAADCMRWEILHRHGGFAVDADSECLKRLPEAILSVPFVAYENEVETPGLVAAGAMAFRPRDVLVGAIVDRIERRAPDSHRNRPAWQSVGPRILTEEIAASMNPIKILPSHYFFPRHHTGREYKGTGPVYARQYWGSTRVVS